MRKSIYVLGNPIVDVDSLPLKLLPKLQKKCPDFSFELLDPTEEIQFNENQELILIDTVIGINKVTAFHDLSYFAYSPRVTVHDYDLPITLGLLQKLGKVKNIIILGIPKEGNFMKILTELVNILYNQFILRK